MPDPTPSQVEDVFVREALTIPGIAAALAYEPENTPARPGLSMLMTRYDQDDTETGPGVSAFWDWRVSLYLVFRGGRDMQTAQTRLKAFQPEVMKITRRNPSMDGLVQFASLRDGGDDPVFNADQEYLWKPLRLSCRVTLYDG